MMKNILIYVAFFATILTSCKKDDPIIDNVAGKVKTEKRIGLYTLEYFYNTEGILIKTQRTGVNSTSINEENYNWSSEVLEVTSNVSSTQSYLRNSQGFVMSNSTSTYWEYDASNRISKFHYGPTSLSTYTWVNNNIQSLVSTYGGNTTATSTFQYRSEINSIDKGLKFYPSSNITSIPNLVVQNLISKITKNTNGTVTYTYFEYVFDSNNRVSKMDVIDKDSQENITGTSSYEYTYY
jgi:hypothetical protein